MSRQQFMERFIHIPINNALTINMKFEAMDYDINIMRINAIDNRDKIYKDKIDWIEKYGTYVAFGLIVALVLGVLYMSYGYSERVIGAVMGKVQETLSIVEQLASKIGGVPPAS